MKTFASAQKDRLEGRYTTDDMKDVDGTSKEGAKKILSSRGGKKAAQHAIATLYAASIKYPQGYLSTAVINAPLRVLQALERTGLIEQAEDNQPMPVTTEEYQKYEEAGLKWAWRFRLSEFGKQVASGVKNDR